METKNKNGHHKIAIVGVGSLFPGALDTKDFWLNILNERDFIKDVPSTHWLKEDYYDPTDKTGDKIYCQKGAFLDDISFDPVEYGMPPNLLSATDTVQLLSLVVAKNTLSDTKSFQSGKVDSTKTSVILGVAGGTELIGQMSARIHTPEWVMSMRNQGLAESKIQAILKDIDGTYATWTENTFPGLLGNVVSGRIANRFNLRGTNCVLDAACASSLAAVKMAVQELQLGTTDMVVTGGSDALNDIFMYMCFSKTTALSPTEDCKPFSDTGDGTVLGEAVAMMSLKRLEDAERDGDKIYAVISSVGSSSDGKSGSIYAPDSVGQSLAIKRAYEGAGFSPNDIDLVEAHGTGTMAGDYSEFNGLKLAYGETEFNQYCALGSVKSMIGHTKSAAGASSMLKIAMALNNKILPPTLKIERPNPKLKIEESPFYLNTYARPWIHHESSSRKAGVSSMGFGGTNFHVALEEYDNATFRPKKVYRQKKELLLFSTDDAGQLIAELTKMIDKGLDQDLVQLAKLHQNNFDSTLGLRLAILGESMEEVQKWAEHTRKEIKKESKKIDINNSVYYSTDKPDDKVAYLFSGQGSQYINMGSDLIMQYDEALNPWDKVSEMNLDAKKKLNEIVYPIPVFNEADRIDQSNLLVDTKWAQPAIGTLAISHLNLLKKIKLTPTIVGGHSYGEVAALYAAGIIESEKDFINISRMRGVLMAKSEGKYKGAMSAVFASEKEVKEILKKAKTKVVIANINSPSQTVISGYSNEIMLVEKVMENLDIRFQRLSVSTAFHSELVADSTVEFEKYLSKIKFGKPKIPVYSNTTGGRYNIKGLNYAKPLAQQLAAPVQFEKQINAMYAEGVRTFLEIGPNKVLGNFTKDILKGKPHNAISIDGGKKVNSKDAFWNALGQLSVAGVSLSFSDIWENIDDNEKIVSDKKPSIATVKINGSNYGKPYPPKGGFKSLPKPNPEEVEVPVNSVGPQSSEGVIKKSSSTLKNNIELNNSNNHLNNTPTKMSGINSEWLAAFESIQKNTLDAQKRFQETLMESHKLFLETSQTAIQNIGALSGQNNFVQPQTNHSEPLNNEHNQKGIVNSVVPEVDVQKKPIAPKEIEKVKEPLVELIPENSIDFKEVMLQIVSDKTGYPKEILDLSTDLESGLGIDSIKRVEILSALQEEFPELKNVDTAKLAAMSTLGEILNYSNSGTTTTANTSEVLTEPSIDFKEVMLQIVSDKTGYPKEILDLSTDLESGLGIDSIKRVEILSALQEEFPELKNVDTAKLAAMSTLGEIMEFSNNSFNIYEGGVSEDSRKKFLSSGKIFRYIVSRGPITDNGFGLTCWGNGAPLFILADDKGIAKELEKLFNKVEIKTSIVSKLPDNATHIINLEGLNSFEGFSIEQILESNKASFDVANQCGKKLFDGSGCLILPFDNGLSNPKSYDRAWSGGISALAKTAKLEWPEAEVLSLNIDTWKKAPKKIASELFAAITSGGKVTEIEIDTKGNNYQLLSTVAGIEDQSRSLNDGDSIIVSGGAKGVTAACLISLSERKKLNIGILGRTLLENELEYLKEFKTDGELKGAVFQQAIKNGLKITPIEVNNIVSKTFSNREIQETLEILRKNGSKVNYISVDISSKTKVTKAVNQLRKEFGSIQGIIHAAGVLADKYIHEKTAEQFNKVFATKIAGFINMLEATANDKLTHICCFSSVAARMGNVGQVDYAMANEVLNKVCQAEQLKRKKTCLVKSLNWGPWDGGMVSLQLKKHFKSLGVDLIPLERGAEIFADEMEDASIDNVEIVVGGSFDLWGKKGGTSEAHIHKMWVHKTNNAFLESHRIENNVIVPLMMATEWSMRLAKSVYPNLNIIEVKNVKVYKGIQLDHFDSKGDILEFIFTKDNKVNTEVDIKIQNETGTLFYGITVVMSNVVVDPEKKDAFVQNLKSWKLNKEEIYQKSLFHGPDFQVIESLEGISDNGCTGILALNAAQNLKKEDRVSDFFLYDGSIQMAILAMEKWTGNKSSLPLGYKSLIIYNKTHLVEKLKCELILKNKGDMNSEWDIHFRNLEDEVVAEMKGLRMYMYQTN